ncbi:nucleoid-associated protein [Vibrio vulnificus]|uniref:nucleoid-associated protein n=1 Tax=Vibrio vulnificus TaxID=672 RepID=UPI001594161F|nr:nucleoid-associated protein [Vibrio vulnificus]NVC40715.1 nucleoid-associated protein [Vibrio vulnificus]
MSKQLKHLIISSIKRSPNNNASANTRATEIDVSELPQSTVDSLTGLFIGGGMKTGVFVSDSAYKRELLEKTTLNGDDISFSEFRTLSAKLANLLAQTLNQGQAQQAKDGFLVSYVYSSIFGTGEDTYTQTYLCNVFLHRVEGVDINEDLTFEEIERINLDNLSLGARVCVDSVYSDDSNERPITFKISGRTIVSKFFLKFIGGEEPENSTEDTKRLKDAIEKYASENGYDIDGIECLCDRAKAFCKERIQQNDGYVSILDLAAYLFVGDDKRTGFVTLLQDEYSISETFLVNTSEVNKFTNLYVKTSEFTLQFKTKALSTNIDWDPENQSLTFSNLPEDAVNQILTYLPNRESVTVNS